MQKQHLLHSNGAIIWDKFSKQIYHQCKASKKQHITYLNPINIFLMLIWSRFNAHFCWVDPSRIKHGELETGV